MKTLISVDSAGRLVLPKAMRESLHLRGRGLVKATLTGNRVELEPVTAQPVPVKKIGRFLVIKSSGKDFDAVAELEASRRER
jgi:bifunctional DNA-binding transcriptional regulator/antitoxin component of YhaV-PrlF toxin-antitoxin module